MLSARFPFLPTSTIMKGVSYRWSQLSKRQKQPFEQAAMEDK